jgi:activating signal cointegrator complex subunit 3
LNFQIEVKFPFFWDEEKLWLTQSFWIFIEDVSSAKAFCAEIVTISKLNFLSGFQYEYLVPLCESLRYKV